MPLTDKNIVAAGKHQDVEKSHGKARQTLSTPCYTMS
jgi:hypothetical protein